MKRRFAEFLERKRNENAFVLPMLAICISTLILFIGFGVDVTTWYLRANRIQRAADAAALAGAAEMPDTAAAIAAAQATAEKNGFVDGNNSLHVTFEASPPNKLSVHIRDDNVPSFFARSVLDHLTIGRDATAEFLSSVPMGSPFNILGTGDQSTHSSLPKQNFWLAVNGYCTAKEDGDLFLSRYDGNRTPAGPVTCPYPSNLNEDYNPDGYDFIVEVPAGFGGTVNAEIYDAAYNNDAPDGKANLYTEPDPTVTTTYTLWDENFTDDKADDTQLESKTFVTDDPDPAAYHDWWDFSSDLTNSDALRPHKYRIQVQTLAGEMGSWGINSFGLRALHNGSKNGCDSRIDATCPSVYAENAMSVLSNLNPSGGSGSHKVTFYLAKIDKGYTGDPMTVSMWDPGDPGVAGETGKSISLIQPDGTQPNFYWSSIPLCCGYTGFSNSLDVSGLGPQPGNSGTRFGTSKFNDRRVDMTLQIPSNYPATVDSAGSDWWQIQYTLPPDAAPQDRATWSVTITGSDPVHLVRN